VSLTDLKRLKSCAVEHRVSERKGGRKKDAVGAGGKRRGKSPKEEEDKQAASASC
jgi:hypothetical protein